MSHLSAGSSLEDEGDRLTADKNTRKRETFGSHGGLQGLGRNDTLKRGVGETEDDVEEVVPDSSATRSVYAARMIAQ